MSPLKLIGGVAVEKKTSRLKRLQRRFIVCGLTPIMLLFFIFSVVPIIFSIVMSFYNYNGFPGAPFVGLANYKMLFQDPEFLGALKNTVVFVLVAVVLNICISTFLAVLIKSLRKKGERSFFRGWMFLPAVVPIVAVCYISDEMVNVINNGYIDNVSSGIIVELPTYIDEFGLHPQKIGKLPDAIAAQCDRLGREYLLMVEAAATCNYELARQAMFLDPLVSNCKYPELLLKDLIRANLDLLPEAWEKHC